MESVEYTLPTYLACYLINGDATGLTEDEIERIQSFLAEEKVCIVSMEDDTHFRHSNDFENLGADCATFTGYKIK